MNRKNKIRIDIRWSCHPLFAGPVLEGSGIRDGGRRLRQRGCWRSSTEKAGRRRADARLLRRRATRQSSTPPRTCTSAALGGGGGPWPRPRSQPRRWSALVSRGAAVALRLSLSGYFWVGPGCRGVGGAWRWRLARCLSMSAGGELGRGCERESLRWRRVQGLIMAPAGELGGGLVWSWAVAKGAELGSGGWFGDWRSRRSRCCEVTAGWAGVAPSGGGEDGSGGARRRRRQRKSRRRWGRLGWRRKHSATAAGKAGAPRCGGGTDIRRDAGWSGAGEGPGAPRGGRRAWR